MNLPLINSIVKKLGMDFKKELLPSPKAAFIAWTFFTCIIGLAAINFICEGIIGILLLPTLLNVSVNILLFIFALMFFAYMLQLEVDIFDMARKQNWKKPTLTTKSEGYEMTISFNKVMPCRRCGKGVFLPVSAPLDKSQPIVYECARCGNQIKGT